MKEIGGYPEMENYCGNEYHNNCYTLNNARNALRLVIKHKNIEKIYLPYFICDSVIDSCKKEKIKIEFYHVNKNLEINFTKKLKDKEFLYVVNYYGMLKKKYILKLKKEYINIILDNVQNFFDKNIDNIITIYSCRKYFGVTDGAYLYANIKIDDLEKDYSYDRYKYILGRYELSASEFYNEFKKTEEIHDNLEIKEMSKVTKNILKSIAYDEIIKRRNNNFNILYKKLKKYNLLDVNITKGPYMYPLLVDNGSVIREKLLKKKIYVPILWPNVESTNLDEYYLSRNILPLTCSQMYNKDDMLKMAESIIETIKELKEDVKIGE